MRHRIRPACLVLFLSLYAACAPLSPATPAATASPIPPALSPSPTRTVAVPGTLPPAPLAELEQTFLQVERLRGLEAQRTLAASMVTQSEIERLTRAAFLAAWPAPSIERDVLLLRRFGLDEPGPDLDAIIAALGLGAVVVSEAPDGGLAVSSNLRKVDEDLTQVACAYDRWLLVESIPSLATVYQADACASDADACLASRALLQGDAALVAEQWQRTFGSSPRPPRDALAACTVSPATIDPVASALVRIIAFPVQQGVGFARGLFLKAGWAGVDHAYADPPISTEQILHPERYPKDKPRPPELPDLAPSLGLDWTTDDAGVLGEWRTLLVLEAFLASDEAALAASGWDGDRYALLSGPEESRTALVLLTRWDTVRDAHEFSGAFRTYGENRFGPGRREGTTLTWTTPSGMVVLDVGNDQTLWIEAPDAASVSALREASGFPLH